MALGTENGLIVTRGTPHCWHRKRAMGAWQPTMLGTKLGRFEPGLVAVLGSKNVQFCTWDGNGGGHQKRAN